MLPILLIPDLRKHLDRVRERWDQDLAEGLGTVWLPPALARKSPQAEKEWIWQWVFPSRQLSVDPRRGIQRRPHTQPSVLQKALAQAARACLTTSRS